MFGSFRAELFPDECEVVMIPPHNQSIYLIQKNGTSSLREESINHHYRILKNHQLRDLSMIDIYIRNPRARYISGVNTYLQHLARDHPQLDQATARWFAKRYKFLNRHYLPQLYWLQNLSRFISPDTQLRLRDFADIGIITSIRHSANVVPPSRELVAFLLSDDPDLELWLHVDQILLDLVGNTLTWSALCDHYASQHPDIAANVLS